MKPKPERRKIERFEPTEYFFAAVRPDYKILGKIIDISRRGLLFHYVCDINDQCLEKEPLLSIDIFNKHWNLFILEIPCKVVDEDCLPKNDGIIASVEMRFCRLKFLELSRDKTDSLNTLITVSKQKRVPETLSTLNQAG
jgi:hypothetical protein